MPTRVLIIDDALPLHRIVGLHLRDQGVELHSALDAASGLSAAGRLRPAVILLDIDLPDLDGFEVYRRLRSAGATADIPVIFLTADAADDHRRAALGLGAADYVIKPLRAGELSARVRATVGARSLADRARGADAVTGLWTLDRLDGYLAAAGGGPMAAVVADVGGLRLVNARHGPAVGDAVLRAVGRAVSDGCAAARGVCGAGGGRFVAVLPGADRRAGRAFAGGVADALAARPAVGPGGVVVARCCFGVADTAVADAACLVGRAAAALAHAKRGGPARIAAARRTRRRGTTAA